MKIDVSKDNNLPENSTTNHFWDDILLLLFNKEFPSSDLINYHFGALKPGVHTSVLGLKTDFSLNFIPICANYHANYGSGPRIESSMGFCGGKRETIGSRGIVSWKGEQQQCIVQAGTNTSHPLRFSLANPEEKKDTIVVYITHPYKKPGPFLQDRVSFYIVADGTKASAGITSRLLLRFHQDVTSRNV